MASRRSGRSSDNSGRIVIANTLPTGTGPAARKQIDEVHDHLEQLLFFAGVETLTKREQANASVEAAKIMARLFNALAGEDAHEAVGDDAPTTPEEEDEENEFASVLMTRLLFLLYGDDAGLWEQDLFYRWIESVASKNIGPSLIRRAALPAGWMLNEAIQRPYQRAPFPGQRSKSG